MEQDLFTQKDPADFYGCLYFGLIEDPSTKSLYPTKNGSCHATTRPTLIDLDYQYQFCLKGQHKNCPVYVQRAENHTAPNLTFRKGFWVTTKAATPLSGPRIWIVASIVILLLLLGASFGFLSQGWDLPALAQGIPSETPTVSSAQKQTPATEFGALIAKASATSTIAPTATPTHTPTTKPSATASATATANVTATVTASMTASTTPDPTNTATTTPTQTATATATTTPTQTATATATTTPTQTATAVSATQPPPKPTTPPVPTATEIPPQPTASGPPPATATKISLNP